MKCKYCGEEMVVDDEDIWEDHTDIYLLCNKCDTSCIRTIYNKLILKRNVQEWYKIDDTKETVLEEISQERVHNICFNVLNSLHNDLMLTLGNIHRVAPLKFRDNLTGTLYSINDLELNLAGEELYLDLISETDTQNSLKINQTMTDFFGGPGEVTQNPTRFLDPLYVNKILTQESLNALEGVCKTQQSRYLDTLKRRFESPEKNYLKSLLNTDSGDSPTELTTETLKKLLCQIDEDIKIKSEIHLKLNSFDEAWLIPILNVKKSVQEELKNRNEEIDK